MIIDSSALIAILFNEREAVGFAQAMAGAETRAISAATVLEATIVSEGRGGTAQEGRVDQLLREARAEIVPVTADQARIAQEGWRRFGKGRHPAALNFGDCFAYALARERNQPLLFKGNDFTQTDVKAAI